MEAQHTPGPWEPFVCSRPLEEMPNYLRAAIEASGGLQFQMVAAFDELGQCDVCMVGNGPRGEANARLIAAAPDLLAALKWALSEIGHVDISLEQYRNGCHAELHPNCPVCAGYQAAKAAIAKAEGGQP